MDDARNEPDGRCGGRSQRAGAAAQRERAPRPPRRRAERWRGRRRGAARAAHGAGGAALDLHVVLDGAAAGGRRRARRAAARGCAGAAAVCRQQERPRARDAPRGAGGAGRPARLAAGGMAAAVHRHRHRRPDRRRLRALGAARRRVAVPRRGAIPRGARAARAWPGRRGGRARPGAQPVHAALRMRPPLRTARRLHHILQDPWLTLVPGALGARAAAIARSAHTRAPPRREGAPPRPAKLAGPIPRARACHSHSPTPSLRCADALPIEPRPLRSSLTSRRSAAPSRASASHGSNGSSCGPR